jgi:hypothetical protein
LLSRKVSTSSSTLPFSKSGYTTIQTLYRNTSRFLRKSLAGLFWRFEKLDCLFLNIVWWHRLLTIGDIIEAQFMESHWCLWPSCQLQSEIYWTKFQIRTDGLRGDDLQHSQPHQPHHCQVRRCSLHTAPRCSQAGELNNWNVILFHNINRINFFS